MLSSDGADHVYPPAEDTHLLMDVLAADAASFAALGAPHCLCLELGFVCTQRPPSPLSFTPLVLKTSL